MSAAFWALQIFIKLAVFTCTSDTDVHRLGAKLWTTAWEGIVGLSCSTLEVLFSITQRSTYAASKADAAYNHPYTQDQYFSLLSYAG